MMYRQRNAVAGYVLVLSFLLGFCVFYLVPYVISIGLSFTQGVGDRDFVGIENYISLFYSKAFLLAGKNTIIFTFTAIPLMFAVSVALALYLNEKLRKIEIYRSLFILPLILPTASIILFWQIMFADQGITNFLLKVLNLSEVDFFNSSYSMLIVVLIYVWKYSGYAIVLFLSGLNSINKNYYENACIDGATKFQRFSRITLPLLKPTAFLVLILSFINSLAIFREVYLLSGGYPHESIYMIQHFMNNNFNNLNYQRLTSASTLLSVIIISVTILLYLRQRKADVY